MENIGCRVYCSSWMMFLCNVMCMNYHKNKMKCNVCTPHVFVLCFQYRKSPGAMAHYLPEHVLSKQYSPVYNQSDDVCTAGDLE